MLASKAVVLGVELMADREEEVMFSLLLHNKESEDKLEFSLSPLRMLRHPMLW